MRQGLEPVTNFRFQWPGEPSFDGGRRDLIEKLHKICEGLNNRFSGNRDAFRILARLMEECGELAAEVHHFEGFKKKRDYPPDKGRLAKECMDVLTATLHLAMLFGVQAELEARVDKHYQMVIGEGLVADER